MSYHLISVKAVNKVIANIAKIIRQEGGKAFLAVQNPQFYDKYANFATALIEFEVYEVQKFRFHYRGIILPT